MADESLYIVNCGATTLTGVVRPRSGEDLEVAVGPKSFATVAKDVTGPLPWHIMYPPTITAVTVKALPAIATFDPNVLTAVVYPGG